MRIYLIFDVINVNDTYLFYTCLIFLIQCGPRKLILFYFYQIWCSEKVDNLQKFRSRSNKVFVDILIFLVFSSKSGIRHSVVSVCKVLVSIKVVPVRNNYFGNPKFESHTFQQMNGFLCCRSFY